MLTGQESSSSVSAALARLANCDIIIDATADSEIFNLLSAVAYRSDTPYIWMEVFEGGIGGFVGRFRPGLEPTPIAMRATLLDYLSEQGAPETTTNGNYTAIDQEGNTIIATDADVSIISGYATNMSLDILSKNAPSVFPHSMYLVGLRKGWIFEEPFFTLPIDPLATETEAKSVTMDQTQKDENLEFLHQLLNNREQ